MQTKLFDLHEKYNKHDMRPMFLGEYIVARDVEIYFCACGKCQYTYAREHDLGLQDFNDETHNTFVLAAYASALVHGMGKQFIDWLKQAGAYSEFFDGKYFKTDADWGHNHILTKGHPHHGKIKHLLRQSKTA